MTVKTRQAVAIILKQMRKQKVISMTRGSLRCAYRGKDERKCAIGALIPDQEYKSDWEGRGAAEVEEIVAIGQRWDLCKEDMQDLQEFHDTYAEWGCSCSLASWVLSSIYSTAPHLLEK